MHAIAFFLFLLILGFLIEGAKKRGEIRFSTTKDEQRRLDNRGRLLMALCWAPTAALLCKLLDWMAGGIPEKDQLVVYGMVSIAAGIPAGLIAFGFNVLFEHIGVTRIQRSNHR